MTTDYDLSIDADGLCIAWTTKGKYVLGTVTYLTPNGMKAYLDEKEQDHLETACFVHKARLEHLA